MFFVLLILSGPHAQGTAMLLCHYFGSLSELYVLVCIHSALNELSSDKSKNVGYWESD